MNLFKFLHEESTKKWIAKTIERSVSWDRIIFICVSVLSYQKGVETNINVLDDGSDGNDDNNRVVEIKNMSESVIAKKVSKQKPSKVSDSETVYQMPGYSMSIISSDTNNENPPEPCSEVSSTQPLASQPITSSGSSNSDDKKQSKNPTKRPLESSCSEASSTTAQLCSEQPRSRSSSRSAEPSNNKKVTVRIRQEPIILKDGTALDPKITIALCGGGREAVRNFFGKYFGNRPWFISDKEEASYARNEESNGMPVMKRLRLNNNNNNK